MSAYSGFEDEMSDYCEPHEFQPKPDEVCPYCVSNRLGQELRTASAEGGRYREALEHIAGYFYSPEQCREIASEALKPVSTGRNVSESPQNKRSLEHDPAAAAREFVCKDAPVEKLELHSELDDDPVSTRQESGYFKQEKSMYDVIRESVAKDIEGYMKAFSTEDKEDDSV